MNFIQRIFSKKDKSQSNKKKNDRSIVPSNKNNYDMDNILNPLSPYYIGSKSLTEDENPTRHNALSDFGGGSFGGGGGGGGGSFEEPDNDICRDNDHNESNSNDDYSSSNSDSSSDSGSSDSGSSCD